MDGSRLQDQEVDRWIKIKESKNQEAITIPMPRLGTPGGLFKSLKWIDGSRLKKARPKKQSLYRCPCWGCRWSPQVHKVDRWIKIKESKSLEGITIKMPRLDTEGLFKSLTVGSSFTWLVLLFQTI